MSEPKSVSRETVGDGKSDCPVCHGLGWRCEAHPDQPMDHDPDCAGPGEPCDCNEGWKVK